MSLFGKKGGGLFGSLAGIALAFATGGSSVALSTIATYASIGFTIGNLVAPPQFDEELPEFTAPEVAEGTGIPIIVGRHRTFGIITYFNADRVKSGKFGEYDRLYWAPMQVALCVCETAPTNDAYGSLYLSSQGLVTGQTPPGPSVAVDEQIGIKPLNPDEPGQPQDSYPYFPYKVSKSFYKFIVGFEGYVEELTEAIEGYKVSAASGSGNYVETDLSLDIMLKSWPQISWGGDPVYWFDEFEDPEWAPNTVVGYPEKFNEKESFAGYWKEDLPPLKNVLTLSSPVWSLGENVSTAPRTEYEVWGIYPSDPGDFFVEIYTNLLWGAGLSEDKLNLRTFTGDSNESSLTLFAQAEGLTINANLPQQTAERLIDKMNFHLGTIIREDHLGRLEVVALRSLVDGPTFTQENYEAWIAEGSPDTGGSYTPGFPVLYEIYDGEALDVDVSNQLWSSTKNFFTGTFKDAEQEYKQSSVVIRDNSTRTLTVGYKEQSYTFDMFTGRDQVTSRLMQLAKSDSVPGASVRLTLPLSYFGVRAGDGIKLWDENNDMSGVYLRVHSVSEAKMGTNEIVVECLLDSESLYKKNLLTVDVQAPAQGQEPEIPDDPFDPQGVSAHPDFWDHNLAYEDAESPLTNDKKTHIYVAPGGSLQTGHKDFAVEGVLNPFVDVPIPSIAKGTVYSDSWGYQFVLLTPLGEGDFYHSHEDGYCLLQLLGYDGQSLVGESFFGTKTNTQLEESQVVLVLSGRPGGDQDLAETADSETTENVTEIIRFRSFEHVGGDIYKVSFLSRSANKELAYGWSIGSFAWVADLSEKNRPADLPYELWPHKSLAMHKDKASVEEGSHRVRVFTQSVNQVVVDGNEEGTGYEQPETEGLSRTFDALNSSFFSGDEYHEAKIAPMVQCTSVRIGDVPKFSGLWHILDHSEVTNLLSSAFDLSSWTMPGITETANVFGLSYAPAVKRVSKLRWTASGTVIASKSVSSGLTTGVDYSLVAQVSLAEGACSAVEIRLAGNGSTDAHVAINWNTGVTSTGGTALAYEVGGGVWRVFLTSERTGSNDLDIEVRATGTGSGQKGIYFGEALLYAGTTQALFQEKDWLTQFAPMSPYGGIGDFSLVPGAGGSGWGTLSDDDIAEDISTNLTDGNGTYKIYANITHDEGIESMVLADYPEEVTVSPGDHWPTFKVSDNDLALQGLSETPSGSGDFHPKQVSFRVAKKGSNNAYGRSYGSIVKGPWSDTFQIV